MSDDDKFRILIIDDERSNILALNHILKPLYATYAAIDGHTALELAKDIVPDLILLDVIMPDMTGFEVLAELKHHEATQRIPVIFITGLDSTEDEETGFFLGAVDYITKPFHDSIVRARVKTHLQIVKQIRTIEKLGMIDALTEIPNRRGFNNQMKTEWARAIREKNPISVLMIDIDKFKDYNDKYGHPQGDMLLQSLAKTFKSVLRRPADYVARLSGDEFMILLPNTDLPGALNVAEVLRARVEQVCRSSEADADTLVTVSVGINSKTPPVGDDYAAFIAAADKSLYQAKNSGRNRICAHN